MSRRKRNIAGYSIITAISAGLMLSGLISGSASLAMAGAFALAPWAALLAMEVFDL
ncbi:hypothetical protein HOU02_gp423 [Caulobacter phage CcrBL9]|uniref:Uncharacterized protein n=1 Tax=Caulobacter phage CcrBL9 TaxID=2283270 RepID=A0A385EEM1_9CAUD|nr:hypothetical protein HOU02_gp423 [Caulobacter phage CcrBL9]AXQ69302.1 hypothetical protein CcrBL9_gp278c [Caulobacter phage CcrBL9]